MSTDTESVDVRSADSVVELLQRWYHVPALAATMLFMLWVRLRPYGNFVRDEVYFSGNDAYYHFRETSYVVENYPTTMPFDPWTRFPVGTSADHFGTLFDQLIATAILIVGLGSPTERQAAIVFAVAPAVFGALCALPTYYVARRLSGRIGGIAAVGVLALLPGSFLYRSVVGFTDHHVAEVLFQATAIAAMMVALTVAERQRPVYEQFQERDWAGLRDTITWSAIAGVALVLYLWTWPPGVVLVGIFGVFFAVSLSVDVLQGRSPEHVAIVGAISLAVAAVFSVVSIDEFAVAPPATMSLLQPALALAVAAGCAFMAWLAREWDRRDLDRPLYPATVGAIAGAGVVVAYIAIPSLVTTVWRNLRRTLFVGQSDEAFTISEAQSTLSQPGTVTDYLFTSYGFTYIVALIGVLWLCARLIDRKRYRSERMLVVVWAVFTALMALTQVRFHYYLAVVVAVTTGLVVARILRLLEIPSVRRIREIEPYQVMAVVLVVLVIVYPLAMPVGGTSVFEQSNPEQNGPGTVQIWDDNLDWMADNTPEPGNYRGAGKADELEYYGTYDHTDDHDYPEGAYGVMSWWDYGHWITVEGERIPVANPFQQGARSASAFLTAQSEERAELIAEAIERGEDVRNQPTDELRETVAETPDTGEEVRYVMIDYQMAAGKFGAITEWTAQPDLPGQDTIQFQSEAYFNSMLGQLYYGDAATLSHYRLVHEHPTQIPQLGTSAVKTFERVDGATLTGEADPGQNVVVAVDLETDADRQFTYVQETTVEDDGTFELTVPYATDDELGPEDGYTDSAVEATGEYTVVAGENVTADDYEDGEFGADVDASAETAVPEEAVVDGGEIAVDLSADAED